MDLKRPSKDEEFVPAIQEAILKLRKKIAKMVLKKGGNAVVSYRQNIDDEGLKSRRFVIRAYGTAVLVDHSKDDFDPITLKFDQKQERITFKAESSGVPKEKGQQKLYGQSQNKNTKM